MWRDLVASALPQCRIGERSPLGRLRRALPDEVRSCGLTPTCFCFRARSERDSRVVARSLRRPRVRPAATTSVLDGLLDSLRARLP